MSNNLTSTIFQEPPESPDRRQKYLFYLHGLIVEVLGIRPMSEEHGYYEYEKIVNELAGEGFVVISEARKKDTDVKAYAEKVASQVTGLLNKGVEPGNITVVGASKGGVITAYASMLLANKELNYVFLSGLFEKCLVDENLNLYGNVLSIHDSSDSQAITPQAYFRRSEGQGRFSHICLELGLGHGLIYQPRREWIDPMLEWQGMK